MYMGKVTNGHKIAKRTSGDVAMDLVYGVVPPVTRVQLGLRLTASRNLWAFWYRKRKAMHMFF